MGIIITTNKKIEEEYERRNIERSIKEHKTILENERLQREIKRIRAICPVINAAYKEPMGCESDICGTKLCRYCTLKPMSKACGNEIDKVNANRFYEYKKATNEN